MRLTLPLILVITLSACGGDEFQDLRDFVKNAGSDLRGKSEPPPELKPYEPFIYDNSLGLPNPFQPRKLEAASGGRGGLNQPDLTRHKEALEEYPLEGLKMVGYLSRANVPHAVVRSPDGKIHRVKVGNFLGANFGKIVSITDNEITVKETVQDSAGDWAERMSNLMLAE